MLVVLSASEQDITALTTEDCALFDLLEIRLDLCSREFLLERADAFISRTGKPLILTYRLPADSDQKGASIRDPEEIRAFLDRHNLPSNYIDVEFGNNNPFFTGYTDSGYKKIYSFHDFHSTLTYEQMMDLIPTAPGADIFKFAVTPSTAGELAAFLQDIKKLNNEGYKTAGIAMGEKGIISRVFGDKYLSALTYCSLNESRAPGQITIRDFQLFRAD